MPVVVSREAVSPFLSGPELQELLGISRATLRLWRGKGLPFVGGVGVLPKYEYAAVRRWLEDRRPPSPGPEAA